MRIRQYGPKKKMAKQRAEALRLLLDQPSVSVRRPCEGCDTPCPCPQHSVTCSCACSPDCPDLPAKLSSDPVRFPVEPGIVQLVYAFAELGVVPPCWSCEGHEGDGRILRLPQVWFYSESTAYPEIIAQHLIQLRQAGGISDAWNVVVSPHTDCNVMTFVIRPEPGKAADVQDQGEFIEPNGSPSGSAGEASEV